MRDWPAAKLWLSNHCWLNSVVPPGAYTYRSVIADRAVALLNVPVIVTVPPAATLVGATEALSVKLGAGTGEAVGAAVGVAVGTLVGVAVGAIVSDAVGAVVGDAVGAAVGDTVAEGVGAGVARLAVAANVAAESCQLYCVP